MGLTQKEMAEKLGISYSTVNRLEGGKFKPSADTLERFNFLGSPITSSRKSESVFDELSMIIEKSRFAAIRAVNVALLQRNFLLGKRISEEILRDKRANYGAEIVQNRSVFLSKKYGSGFDRS